MKTQIKRLSNVAHTRRQRRAINEIVQKNDKFTQKFSKNKKRYDHSNTIKQNRFDRFFVQSTCFIRRIIFVQL